jgi:hypothetical protein
MAKGMVSTDPINDGLGVRGDGDEGVGMVGLTEHLQHRARLNQSITHTVNKSISQHSVKFSLTVQVAMNDTSGCFYCRRVHSL